MCLCVAPVRGGGCPVLSCGALVLWRLLLSVVVVRLCLVLAFRLRLCLGPSRRWVWALALGSPWAGRVLALGLGAGLPGGGEGPASRNAAPTLHLGEKEKNIYSTWLLHDVKILVTHSKVNCYTVR